MARYRAKHPIFIGSALYEAGQEFESDLDPGQNWEPLDDEARAKVANRPVKPTTPPVGLHTTQLTDIPADWREMKGLDLINLARKLGMTGGKRDDAVKWIEKEVANRAMSAAA